MTHYPMLMNDDCAPENKEIRKESERLVAEFKTEEEYNAIFKSCYDLWMNKNCQEAAVRGRMAARKLPKGWMPPNNVHLLSHMLTEHGIKYTTNDPEVDRKCRWED